MSKKNVIFDSQILNSVQSCAYKTDLIFNKDLQPNQKATPLEEGDLLHKLFEHYNVGLKEGGVQLIYDNIAFEAHVQQCIEYGESIIPKTGLEVSEASEVIFQFDKYVRHNRMDGVTILEVERAFLIKLHEDEDLGIFYCGKIDRLTETPNYGIVPRDYKKTKRTEAPSTTSNQFSGYAKATWPEGASHHYVLVDKIGFQKTLTEEQRFRTYPLTYSKKMIDDWVNETVWWGRMYAYYIDEGVWPRNRTSCDKYAGCIFLPHCEAMDEEQAVNILNVEFYKADKWDPTAVLVKDSKK